MYIYEVRLAVIDCGTNTFNLLIVDMPETGRYTKVYNTRIPVKLGEGAINSGYIASVPFERGINALLTFHLITKEYLAEKVLAYATSAIRDASNGPEFVAAAKQRANVEIDVIDGNREAELIYFGCREAAPLNNNMSLIMDIGGGSTEFILANEEGIKWKQSFNIGAARLLERFNPSSPIDAIEIAAINGYLEEQLKPVQEAISTFGAAELIGSSGAFDSVVEMINGELEGEPLTYNKTAYEINIENYRKISHKVKSSTIEERKQIKGLTPMRFDMIVISCLLIDFALTAFGIDSMRVSTYSLKEGALTDYITQGNN